MRASLLGSRKRRVTSLFVGIFAAVAVAALAYFAVGLLIGEGESSPQKLGTAKETREINVMPLTVELEEPVERPGQKAPLYIYTRDNTTGHAVFIKSFKLWVTTSTPACNPAWFRTWDESAEGSKPGVSLEWREVEEGHGEFWIPGKEKEKLGEREAPFSTGGIFALSDGTNGAEEHHIHAAPINGALYRVELRETGEDEDACEGQSFVVHAKATTTEETH